MERLAFSCLVLFISLLPVADAGSIGVNYGRIANNLPSASKVVSLLKSQGLNRVKLFDSDPAVLKALSGSGIKVTVGLPNELLFAAAGTKSFASTWVQNNVAAYHPSTQIEAIAVGNEVFVDPHNTTRRVFPTRSSRIRFQTLVGFPSPNRVVPHGNAYPFFAYASNSHDIPLDYALFRENPGVVDAGNGLRYFSLFDAQIDAVFAAMSALKYDDIKVVVTETGWPSKGDENEVGASIPNAAAYNGNLVRRILSGGGTPLRPKADLTVYLFALFNENKKNGSTSERNYGLFYPTEDRVYDIPFYPTNSWSGNTWCVAKGDVGKEKLQSALEYACGEGGADCHPIQPGATCYNPNTVEAHASFAFNSFYQKKNRGMGTCYFGGAAYVVSQPPRYGSCEFPTGY
ncbi:hypothetical protein CMV_030760 [Castanea mollissima]|uniref:glucan endo-1,3-beta-D-glucosidase n=1 Tax=Castanea mollissima TaxID=60419 RepID=A0A8J4VC13_9ROSI|nr:hypothetical protein CMV_030760 [Castanea mollissima]